MPGVGVFVYVRVTVSLLVPMGVVTVIGYSPASAMSGTVQVRVVSFWTLKLWQLLAPILTLVIAGVFVPAWKFKPVIVIWSPAEASWGDTECTSGTGTSWVMAVNSNVFV